MVEKFKVSIPDSDMPGWLKTLREGGLTDAEIDSCLSHLNATYGEIKNKEFVEKELSRMDDEIIRRRGFGLTNEEKESLRQGIVSRFKTKR